jgi:hypothetical protein
LTRPSCRCSTLAAGRTKQGYFWAIARDDRPWAGSQPPAVVYSHAPGRGHTHAHALLGGYRGILQCDGYAAYKKIGGSKPLGQLRPPRNPSRTIGWSAQRSRVAAQGSAPGDTAADDRRNVPPAYERPMPRSGCRLRSIAAAPAPAPQCLGNAGRPVSDAWSAMPPQLVNVTIPRRRSTYLLIRI